MKFIRINDTTQALEELSPVTEIEVDFGTAAVFDKVFTITDANVSATSLIVVTQSGKAATGKDADENEWDGLICRAVPAAGQFTLYVSTDTGPLEGAFKLNYIVG